jgi:hypothetical protein
VAFSKKKKRKIIVEDKEYFWSATGNDGWISLHIMTEVQGSSKLSCSFDYHQIPIKSDDITILANQFVITPFTVRQVVEYALSIGWKPFEKGQDIDLRKIDDKIDLKLDKYRAIDEKEFWSQFGSQKSVKLEE